MKKKIIVQTCFYNKENTKEVFVKSMYLIHIKLPHKKKWVGFHIIKALRVLKRGAYKAQLLLDLRQSKQARETTTDVILLFCLHASFL